MSTEAMVTVTYKEFSEMKEDLAALIEKKILRDKERKALLRALVTYRDKPEYNFASVLTRQYAIFELDETFIRDCMTSKIHDEQ